MDAIVEEIDIQDPAPGQFLICYGKYTEAERHYATEAGLMEERNGEWFDIST
jgi:hypothetical protein